MAEISGYDRSLPPARQATLHHVLGDLFPHAAAPGESNFWSGLRPMTPDGPPIVGTTPIANLFLNTGHGTLGWTMARSEEHTSELQSLMRISYAVFCLKKKKNHRHNTSKK